MTLQLEVVVLKRTDGEVPVLKTPVLSGACLINPVLKIPVLSDACLLAPVPAAPVRNTPVLKAEPEAKTDGAAKPFAVRFV